MSGIHCCADSKHQWENFKSIKNLRLLNLNLPHHPEDFQKAFKFFEDTCVQMHSANISDELWLNNNKNMRVVIQDWASDKNDAREKSKRLRDKYCSQ